jgi:IS5 family transposase
VDDSTMPRMYVVQTCFGLSGLACEEQVWGSAAMRRFVGVVPGGAPDATTLCRFRHLPEESGIGAGTLDAVAEPAAGRGLQMAAAPSWMPPSWRAHPPPRAPQGSAVPAHQAKRGQNRHFGHKFGIGADAEGGVPHGAHPDAANVHDLGRLPDLVGEGDEGVWADAGHVGAEGRAASGPRLAGISWHVAKRRSALSGEDLPPESAKSAVRRAVEHAFHIPKDTFGTRRTRLGGLAKDPGFLAAAVAAAGALVARRGPRPFGPPAALSAANQEAKLERFRERARRKAEREAGRAAAAPA